MQYPQENLFDAPAVNSLSADPDNSAEPFGCCAYCRECSDAGHCVAPKYKGHEERTLRCIYRRHLEAGRVFYGKNADGFSRDHYAQLQQRVEALPLDAHSALDDLLIEFLENHRGIRQCVSWNRCTEELAALELFSFRPLGSDFPPSSADLSKMYALIRSAGYGQAFETAQAKRTEERKPTLDALAAAKKSGNKEAEARLKKERAKLDDKKPGPRTWGFLREWLNGDAQELRDRLAAPYCMVSLPPDQILYAEELYRDTLMKSFSARIYPPSPYAEDGLLSAAKWKEEELRRIQLSHGYTPEEKDRLAAAAMGEKGVAV